jgi:hypothetical protein
MKIIPVAAELFHVDGRLDTTKLKVAFRNFANARHQGINPVESDYNYIGLCDTSPTASDILW